MKNLLCVSAILATLNIYAQQISKGELLPMGKKISFGVGNHINPGHGGMNITWDFSGVKLSNGGTFERIEPSQSPYFSKFPNSNYVFRINSSITFYNHYFVSDTSFEWVGIRWGTGGNNLDATTDPIKFLNYPTKYQDMVKDRVVLSDGTSWADTLICDGYGTLKTPYATYENAFRVIRLSEGDTTYDWYVTDAGVFTYSVFQITSTSSRAFNIKTAAGINDDQKTLTASVYPNPAIGNITITAPIKEGTIYVIDLNGKTQLSRPASETTTIRTLGMKPGLYIFRIMDRNGITKFTGKFSVCE